MVSAPDSTLARDLETLLGCVPAGSVVSWDAVRALHVAHGEDLPRIATLAAEHDLELRGSELVTSAATPGGRDEVRHDHVAAALAAGAPNGLLVLRELARHALRGTASACAAFDVTLAATQRDLDDSRFAAILAEVDAAEGDAPASRMANVLERLAFTATDLDHARAFELFERARDATEDTPGARRRTRLAYHASWLAPGERADELMAEVEASPHELAPGWSSRARALERVFDGDLEGGIPFGRRAVLDAVLAGDADLESHALLGLATAIALRGDLDEAILVQERSLARAHVASNWRVAAIGMANLGSMQVEALKVRDATATHTQLLDLITTRQLRAHRLEALLHAARAVALTGDLPRAAAMLEEAIGIVNAPGGAPVGDADATYRAIRVAELSSLLGTPDAADRCREARDAWRADGLRDQELELLLAEFDAGIEQAPEAIDSIVDLMQSAEPIHDAMALTWLARRATIDGDERAAAVLDAAIEATVPGRAPILDLALEEAAAARRGDEGRWRAMVDVATSWREHGFVVDAALVEAGAGIVAAREGAGHDAARLLDEAHRVLAQLGSSRHVRRLREARRRVEAGSSTRLSLFGTGSTTALDRASFDAIRSAGVERTLRPGEQLAPDVVGILESGVLRIEAVDRSASPALVGLASAGSVLGLHRVFDDRPRSFERYVALTACRVTVVPVDALATKASVAADLAHAVARETTLVARRLARSIDLRHGGDIDRRIAHALLDLAADGGSDEQDGVTLLAACITRELVGEVVGASREAATRALTRLVDAGLVARVGRRIGVPDVDALRRWADSAAD